MTMFYCSSLDSEPPVGTVWHKSWNVPFSKRIADQAQWHSIVEKLG